MPEDNMELEQGGGKEVFETGNLVTTTDGLVGVIESIDEVPGTNEKNISIKIIEGDRKNQIIDGLSEDDLAAA